MPIEEKNKVKYFTFDIINKIDFVNHCMSTRIGGVSENQFATMNFGYNRGDSEENVKENYRRLRESVGLSNNIIIPKQVHSTDIVNITFDNMDNDFGNSDGFITKDNNICIAAFSADCVPIFYVDVAQKIIGIAHAGWRGTVNNIAGKLVNKMINEYNSKAEDIIAGIGPSINQCCFEVDEDVAVEFQNKLSWSNKFIEAKGSKYHINLQLINKEHLLNVGLLEKNIEVSTLCTVCNSDIFFSHRVMGNERGNNVSLIEVK